MFSLKGMSGKLLASPSPFGSRTALPFAGNCCKLVLHEFLQETYLGDVLHFTTTVKIPYFNKNIDV